MRNFFRTNKRGLTYLECMIALTIGSLIIMMSYDSLRQGIHFTQKQFSERQQDRDINVALALLGRDLRHATFSLNNRKQIFVGRLTIDGHSQLNFYRTSNTAIQYKMEGDRLFRIGKKKKTAVISNLNLFEVRYFNGQRWSTVWNWDEQHQQPTFGIRGLPTMVSVKLKTKSREREMTLPLLVPLINERLHG